MERISLVILIIIHTQNEELVQAYTLISIKQIHAHMKKFTKLVFTWPQVSGAFPQSNSTRKQFQTKWYQVLRVSRWVSKNLDTILMYKSNKIVSFFPWGNESNILLWHKESSYCKS